MGVAIPASATTTGIGIWEPLFIGGPERELYAGLHRSGAPAPCLGVLLVPPLFHELPRSRRLLAEVASGLAASGLPSLRFDFFGTGDSAGDSEECNFASMCADIEMALRTLCAETGVRRIAVLAWRGGSMPLLASSKSDPRTVVSVLWEPILDGAAWLAELERLDAAERTAGSRAHQTEAEDGIAGQLMGVAVSKRLRRDIGTACVPDSPTRVPHWIVARPDSALLRSADRTFMLPADAPTFGDGVRMDQALFMSPSLQPVIGQLAGALLEMS